MSVLVQSASGQIVLLIARNDWLQLQREYAVAYDSLHPLVNDFAQAALAMSFNRPYVVQRLEHLLSLHGTELDEGNLTLNFQDMFMQVEN